jgi:hypothetical protein
MSLFLVYLIGIVLSFLYVLIVTEGEVEGVDLFMVALWPVSMPVYLLLVLSGEL